MKKLIISFILICLFSCKKEDQPNNVQPVLNEYPYYPYKTVVVQIFSNYKFPYGWIDKITRNPSSRKNIKTWNNGILNYKDSVSIYYTFTQHGEFDIMSQCHKNGIDSTKYMNDTLPIWHKMIITVGSDTVYNNTSKSASAINQFHFNIN